MQRYRRGFTLVEILVVVAIISILAAIAIPAFSSYRGSAYCASIRSDLANLARSQENYYYTNNTYIPVTQTGPNSNFAEFLWSEGVVLAAATGDKIHWTASASHPNCTTGAITYDSAAGGLQ